MRNYFKEIFPVSIEKMISLLFVSGLIIFVLSYEKEKRQIENETNVMVAKKVDNSDPKENHFNRSPSSEHLNHSNVGGEIEIKRRNDLNYNSVDYREELIENSLVENDYSFSSNKISYSNIPILDSFEVNETNLFESNEAFGGAEVFLGASTKIKKNQIVQDEVGDVKTASNSEPMPTSNECSADVLSGTYGNPIGVNILCNYLSIIKYCLSKDDYCDPVSSGTQFNGSITIGPDSGNYFFSYYGESEAGGVSQVVRHNYTINSTYPHLMIGVPQNFYQTTELPGNTFITSSDFGKSSHYIGQINFKATDPTASGLNLSCQEIAENDHLSLFPLPSTILSVYDVSSLLPIQEVKVPFNVNYLEYGINYVSSYALNNNYLAPLYSCSTTIIVLEDFNYFESTIAQASYGDNFTREFEGQFQSFGFFEEEANVFRGPAGEAENEKNGTKLESGLLSIFY